MIAEITAAYEAGKTAYTLAKAISDVSHDVRVNEKVIELQQLILTLQNGVFVAQREIDSLAKAKADSDEQFKAYERWDEEAAGYKLIQLPPGVNVFALRRVEGDTTPPQWLYPKCFMDRKKAFLQKEHRDLSTYHCQNCKLELDPEHHCTPQYV